jgi:ER membrane protein complex subunit 3
VSDALLLDSAIRDWVLLPIAVVMFVTSLLRHHTTILLRKSSSVDAQQLQSGQLLQHAACVRVNGGVLPPSVFEATRVALTAEQGVLARKAAHKANPMDNPALDPSMMTGMLTNNMAMIVPQIALVSWVSFFFSGFVLVKLPFPSTLRFKLMLQQGIALDSIDPSYVSSLSLYFLTMFGLRGVLYIALGEGNKGDDMALMQQQQQQFGGAGQAPDMSKLFAAERDNLALAQHNWIALDAEKRLFERVCREADAEDAASRQ